MSITSLRRHLMSAVAAGLALASLGAAPAQAQEIPAGDIEIVVPFSAGSGLDTMARLVGNGLSEKWDRTVIIKNQPGASGKIGTAAAAKADPDGLTILFTATSYVLNAVLSKQLPYDPENDFRGVMETARATWSLAAHPDFPADTAKEFVDYVKANPGKVNYASAGLGTPHYLAMEMLKLEAGLELEHIPYSGQSEAVTDVISGMVPVMVFPTHIALPLAEDGKLKMLAVFADERVDLRPEMPTMAEEGFPLSLDIWYGFLAPKATPDAIVAQYNSAMNEVIQSPEVSEALKNRGLRIMGGSPEAFDTLIATQVEMFSELVEAANIPKR